MPASVRREAARALLAVMFLTRLPVPAVRAVEPDWLPRSAPYFPLVGGGIGAACGFVLWAAGLLWPAPIPALLAVAAGLLLTGALHEDGLADSLDGTGGRTREARLAIMKDSRIGTYGAIGLALSLALRVAALATLPPAAAVAALVAAGAGARLAAVILLATQPYAGDRAAAKVLAEEPGLRAGEWAAAVLFGAAPLLLLPPPAALAAVLLGSACAGWTGWRLCRPLGGQTGDVLGAVAAVFETGFLLGAAATLPGWP